MIIAVLAGYYFFKYQHSRFSRNNRRWYDQYPGTCRRRFYDRQPSPKRAYATVYPIAMVFLILFIQMIANLIV